MRKRLIVFLFVAVALSVGLRLLLSEPPDQDAPMNPIKMIETQIPEVDQWTFSPTVSIVAAPGNGTADSFENSDICEKDQSRILASQSEEELEVQSIALADDLASTNNAEHLLAAALLLQKKEPVRALDLLSRASAFTPMDRLVAWNQLTLCAGGKAAPCDFDQVAATAIDVDGSNGAVWMEIATLRLDDNDQSAAIEAVRRAIVAPRFDTYFADHVVLVERALASFSDLSFRQRYFLATGYTAAMAGPSYDIVAHCAGIDAGDGVWLELCDQVGSKMFADGRTVLDQAVGTALQKTAARRSGDEEWIEKATANFDAFRTRHRELFADRKSLALLENDEIVLRQYVEDFAAYGEFVALERLQSQAQRLQQDPNYDQCNFVSNLPSE